MIIILSVMIRSSKGRGREEHDAAYSWSSGEVSIIKPYHHARHCSWRRSLRRFKMGRMHHLESPTGTWKDAGICCARRWHGKRGKRKNRSGIQGSKQAVVSKIIYTSRTHSQLASSSLIDLISSDYAPQMTVLGSRPTWVAVHP